MNNIGYQQKLKLCATFYDGVNNTLLSLYSKCMCLQVSYDIVEAHRKIWALDEDPDHTSWDNVHRYRLSKYE